MVVISILLALASAASAASIPRALTYPPLSTSKGFYLVANISDPAMDLDPPVHGQFFEGAHVGAGLNRAVLAADYGRVFYQSATKDDTSHRVDTLFDMGTPPFPGSIGVEETGVGDDNRKHEINANAGLSHSNIVFSDPKETGYAFVDPAAVFGEEGFFAACREGIPYYQNTIFNTVNWISGDVEDAALFPGCVPITLLPQCASLPPLPEGSMASHEYAQDIQCYEEVSANNW